MKSELDILKKALSLFADRGIIFRDGVGHYTVEKLLGIYEKDSVSDIHHQTAEALFGEELAGGKRDVAKTVNFGSLYGSRQEDIVKSLIPDKSPNIQSIIERTLNSSGYSFLYEMFHFSSDSAYGVSVCLYDEFEKRIRGSKTYIREATVDNIESKLLEYLSLVQDKSKLLEHRRKAGGIKPVEPKIKPTTGKMYNNSPKRK